MQSRLRAAIEGIPKRDLDQEDILFRGINFNELLVDQIVRFLSGKHNETTPPKALPNGVKIHSISRAGYRLMEMPSTIASLEQFDDMKLSLLSERQYIDCGRVEHGWIYYLVVSTTTEGVPMLSSDTTKAVEELLGGKTNR